ncbi:MAG: hypothetical protein ACT4OI_04235 [Methanobacteriota archaeon]
MAGLPLARTSIHFASWPRDLHRGALLLGVGSVVYWSSFAIGRVVLWVPYLGILFLDLFLAWIAVLLHVAAWPRLWVGLRDLRARRPREASPVLAWRAFLLTLVLVLSAVVLLPLQYRSYGSTDAWLVVLYMTAFPYLAWTFVPLLALHGVLFGRVAFYLDRTSRRIADLGAAILFSVAAASVALVLRDPEASSFVVAWSVGRGILPGAALVGYLLIAAGLTFHLVPMLYRPHAPMRLAR